MCVFLPYPTSPYLSLLSLLFSSLLFSSLLFSSPLFWLYVISVVSLFVTFSTSANEGQWPRTFVNSDGTTTVIPHKPQKILSTTTTVTGTLIAIDAPVVASSVAGDGKFFAQWADIAKQRNIQQLWAVGSVDTEMAYAVMPDLIVVSATGGDSVYDLVSVLKSAWGAL